VSVPPSTSLAQETRVQHACGVVKKWVGLCLYKLNKIVVFFASGISYSTWKAIGTTITYHDFSMLKPDIILQTFSDPMMEGAFREVI